MTICWAFFGLLVLAGIGGHFGNSYAWNRLAELGERVIPTMRNGQWQIYETPSEVPEDIRKLSYWQSLIVFFQRLKWIGTVGAVLMIPIIVFLCSNRPA
jgi:hypothetical protein